MGLKIPYRIATGLAVFVLLLQGSGTAAKSTTPIFLTLNGDLWSVSESGELRQWTHWGYNDSPAMSPDGNHIAYRSLTQSTLDAVDHPSPETLGGVDSRDLPANIWVLNTQSGNALRVADQPSPDTWMDRSAPAW